MERFAFDRWAALRLAIGALVVPGFALTLVVPRRELPFRLHPDATGGVIEARGGTPLPAGLQGGDRVVPLSQAAAPIVLN